MSKQIYQYLVEDTEFREEWASTGFHNYSVEDLRKKYPGADHMECVDAVHLASEELESEMKKYFLLNNY